MSEQYTYSEAEHYVFPRSRAQVIADELKYYPDPEELRENIIGLSRYYAETPVIDMMKRFAFLYAAAKIDTGAREERPHTDQDFLLGAMLGVHTTVHTMDSDPEAQSYEASRRGLILGHNSLQNLTGDEDDAETVEFLIGSLKVWETELLEKRFSEAPEELQEAVYDLTSQVYAGIYRPQEQERAFMSGYLFATNYIDRTIKFLPPV
jgi:hypothetical protein